MKTAFAALVGAVLWVSPGPATAEKRVAFVVGNGAYEATGVLPNPKNDAEDMTRKLEQLGFEVTKGVDLRADAFVDAVERFATSASDADVALFYYSGHGIQVEGVNYLLPVDFKASNAMNVKRHSLDLNDVIQQMEAAADVNLVFLDACRDNPFAEQLKRKLAAKGRSANIGRGLADQSSGANTMIVYATAPGETASDGAGRNSPFTEAILENIDAPGVEVESLMKRVGRSVAEKTGKTQQPERLSKLSVEFYFKLSVDPDEADDRPESEPSDPALATESAYWRGIEGSQSVSAFEEYLAKVAAGEFRGLFSDLARKRVEELRKSKQKTETKADPEVAKLAKESDDDEIFPSLPRAVRTSGKNGDVAVFGTLSRKEGGQWEEKNNQGTYRFMLDDAGDNEFVLFDKGRNIYLKIDLKGKRTYWRSKDDSKWNPLYRIVKVTWK